MMTHSELKHKLQNARANYQSGKVSKVMLLTSKGSLAGPAPKLSDLAAAFPRPMVACGLGCSTVEPDAMCEDKRTAFERD